MDATAVAAVRGLMIPKITARHALSVAAYFGGFQALMPLAGWQIGKGLGRVVAAWDHWIAFAVLAAIGVHMMRAAPDGGAPKAEAATDPFAPRVMVLLAIATSIDALAAGITLPMLEAPLAGSVATIGLVTAAASTLGLFAGRRFGAALGRRLDFAGGLVLIALGARILVGHLAAG